MYQKLNIFCFGKKRVDFSNLELKILMGKLLKELGKDVHKVLLSLDEFLSWEQHLKHVRGKPSSANFAFSRVKNLFPSTITKTIYNSIFKLEYGLLCWGGVKSSKLNPVHIPQKKSIRHITGKKSREYTNALFKSLGMLKVDPRSN